MPIKPHTIDIVVKDMRESLAFYKCLGLQSPIEEAHEQQVQINTPNAATLGLITEAAVRQHNPHWITPVGQRVTFACSCDSVQELDETYARVTEAGYIGLKAPWDAFWGQRYAFLQDPDGNRVDLFAMLEVHGWE
jgi:predicted lactoylglutathione lyase